MEKRGASAGPSIPVEGLHEHTVDNKGRVSVPAVFRGALGVQEGDELVVTRHLKERCVLVYWPAAWDAMKARADELAAPVRAAVRRVTVASAHRVKVDRLGRIQVPLVLRKYAELDGKCFVMGQGDRMEIWAPVQWEQTHGPQIYAQLDLSDLNL
jgi:MraZ protein